MLCINQIWLSNLFTCASGTNGPSAVPNAPGGWRGQNVGLRDSARFCWLCCCRGHRCFTNASNLHKFYGTVYQAVCCQDGKHCCPNGYKCGTTGKCSKGNQISMKWLDKLPAMKPVTGNINCPDGVSHCTDNQTCCKLSSGQYGCCPVPNVSFMEI